MALDNLKRKKDYNENFIDIKLKKDTVYVYSIRRALQRVLDKKVNMFSGILVDLGCGEMPYREYILDKNKKIKKYIGIDIDFNKNHQTVKPDFLWDGKTIPLNNSFVETVGYEPQELYHYLV